MRISDWSSDVCSSDLIEHKAVAFDTYLHAARSMTPLRRWLKRSTVMCVTTMRFHYVIFRNTADLLAQDGRNNWATWKGLLAWLYGRDGLMRALLRGVFTYMKPGDRKSVGVGKSVSVRVDIGGGA